MIMCIVGLSSFFLFCLFALLMIMLFIFDDLFDIKWCERGAKICTVLTLILGVISLISALINVFLCLFGGNV